MKVFLRFAIYEDYNIAGRQEPWSSGYSRRLMFQRMWVRILTTHTGWTFSHIFVVKI